MAINENWDLVMIITLQLCFLTLVMPANIKLTMYRVIHPNDVWKNNKFVADILFDALWMKFVPYFLLSHSELLDPQICKCQTLMFVSWSIYEGKKIILAREWATMFMMHLCFWYDQASTISMNQLIAQLSFNVWDFVSTSLWRKISLSS